MRLLYGLILLFLIGVAVATVLPLAWTLLGSVKGSQEIFRIPPTWWPERFHWENYKTAWQNLRYLMYLRNTFVLFLGEWASKMVVCITAAYALSKLDPPFKRPIYLAFLATLMIPAIAYLIPRFMVLRSLPLVHVNVVDKYWAFWLPAGVDAFAILLLKSFFDGIPKELYDAAQIDGAGPLRFLTRILLPLSGPVITTITIFTFTFVWNDFAGPLVLLPSSERQTIALGLYRMFADGKLGWNVQLAAAVLVALPPVLVVALLQRFITRGISMTGMQN